MRNTGNHKNNISGVKGVWWNKNRKRWNAYIFVNTKLKYLGAYKNFDEAVCTRLAIEQCLNWDGCDSNSPAYQYVQKILKRSKKKKFPKIIV
jgi:Fe-S oxidoreductase